MLFFMWACTGSEKNAEQTEQIVAEPAQTARMYRLTHTQWNHAVADLLGIDASEYSEDFIGETLGSGFENDADTLVVSPVLFQDYQRAAEGLARKVVGDADIYTRIVPEDVRPDAEGAAFATRLEAEEGISLVGAVSGDGYNLWSNGVLALRVTLPHRGLYRFTAAVEGTDCGDGVGAQFELRVSGDAILEGVALGEQEFRVDVDLEAGNYEVAIAFQNDCYEPDLGYDRNLIVDYIDVVGGTNFGSSQSSLSDLYAWVDRITAQAYRRPLSFSEKEDWHHVFDQGASLIQSGDDFVDGVQLLLIALLQSPHFLYRIEDAQAHEPLSSHELAAKLSFHVCDRPPDESMRTDLADGTFSTNYEAHVSRLLHEPCGINKILDFHRSLLHTKGYENMFKTDELWDEQLNLDMANEVDAFVEEVVMVENGGVWDLYTAAFTMANANIAGLYDVSVETDEFVRVELDPQKRSGLLTLSGVLAYQSDAAQSNPIHRGVFINTSLLCTQLPPPPDMVAPLPVQEEGQSNRERIEQHTGEGTCGEGCHARLINPPGFAFEHYDQLGRFRAEEGGIPVNASGAYYLDEEISFSDGVSFGVALASSTKAHHCYQQQLLQFMMGRAVHSSEEEMVDIMTQESLEGASILALLHLLLQDRVFMERGE